MAKVRYPNAALGCSPLGILIYSLPSSWAISINFPPLEITIQSKLFFLASDIPDNVSSVLPEYEINKHKGLNFKNCFGIV